MTRNVYVRREYTSTIPHVSLSCSRDGDGKARFIVSTINQTATFNLSREELSEFQNTLAQIQEDWQ